MSLDRISENQSKVITFYTDRYAFTNPLFLRPGRKAYPGEKDDRQCRFCGLHSPEATFRQKAHAIPELLGNKTLFSYYECDACNGKFGRGIENDLGAWSKARRTFARIPGKTGVPSLSRSNTKQGWSINYDPSSGFDIKQYAHKPIFEVDEASQHITFHLIRDSYTPIAVLKAFIKLP